MTIADHIARIRRQQELAAAWMDEIGDIYSTPIVDLSRTLAALERCVEALQESKRVLTVPAAEYVPAIPDAWSVIDDALAEAEELLRGKP